MLLFSLSLPKPGASDVVRRELTVTIGDTAIVSLMPAITQEVVESVSFCGADGAKVVTKLVDIDNAGNASEPMIQEFVLSDTIAPPRPGEIGLEVTAEIDDPQPETQPVEPPAPVEPGGDGGQV